MKVVIAPDSFKGTVTAPDAARSLAEGWRSVRPWDELVLRPMADGGEGTLAAVVAAHRSATVHDVPGCTGPDRRPVTGRFALLPDGATLVELAVASGLPLMAEPAARTATTRGTGETIAAALSQGCKRLIVTLGGSASTDGGTGLLGALGLHLFDGNGHRLADGGAALSHAVCADLSALRPPPPGGVVLLTDVTNPLLGPNGAAVVYGPQKGASAEDVLLLERGLTRLATLLGGDPAATGAGAAGGTAYGLMAAWGATVTPGAAAVADLLGLDEALAGADLAITGEGRFDATSLLGKAVGEVLSRAASAGVPAKVVAGESAQPQALALADLSGSPCAARADAAGWLRHAGAHLARSAGQLPYAGSE
ncbi:glycerate kinase [Streptomyces sp. NPDC052107]|uniref:glycerate kinase n=1 Tax=Streptomyces sp. NPDC052107 TaxID=3155632 RepID=UPI00342A9355